MEFLVINGEEYNFIWKMICELQIIFHPRYSPQGEIDFKTLSYVKNHKKIIIFLDRNLFSSILRLSCEGYLKNKGEMRIVALLITWIIMKNYSVSAGLALKEFATKINNDMEPKLELQQFNNIFKYYPSMIWLRLAEGEIDKIPVCSLPIEPFNIEIKYSEEDDHLLMHIAEMLHVVYLYKQHNLSPAEKVLRFLKWNYKFLLVSESTIAYITMLFTNHPGIKPPKNSGSNDIEKILNGCKNQAWDLNYLSNWGCFHYYEKTMDEIFMFATNDVLLKKIFINTYGNGGVGTLIENLFSKSDFKKIVEVVNANQGSKRIKPDFGSDPKKYFRQLINKEKQRVQDLLEICPDA